MTLPLLTRKMALLAKIEAEYGTDPIPTGAANAVLVNNLKITPQHELISRDEVIVGDLSKLPHLIGKYWCDISFDIWLHGSGGEVDTPPDFGVLLRACSMAETVNTDVSVVYAPTSSDQESVTIYGYLDGIEHQIVGCVGNWSLVGEVGQPARMTFNMQGQLESIADESNPSLTIQNYGGPVVLDATWTYDSWTPPMSRFSLTLNNQIAEREDVHEESGIAGFFVGDRRPEGSFDPEAVTIATRDIWSNLKDINEGALSIVIGADTGDIITIAAPKCAKRSVAYGDRGGKVVYEIGFGMYRDSGNDEITLTFT